MSSKAVFFAFIVVFIALVAGIGYMYFRPNASTGTSQTYNTTTGPTATQGSNQISPSTTSSNSSNTQLDQDASSINQSVGSLNTDLDNINQGLNDQQPNLQ